MKHYSTLAAWLMLFTDCEERLHSCAFLLQGGKDQQKVLDLAKLHPQTAPSGLIYWHEADPHTPTAFLALLLLSLAGRRKLRVKRWRKWPNSNSFAPIEQEQQLQRGS